MEVKMDSRKSTVEVWYAIVLPDYSVELVEKIEEFDDHESARQFISRHALHTSNSDALEMVCEGRLVS